MLIGDGLVLLIVVKHARRLGKDTYVEQAIVKYYHPDATVSLITSSSVSFNVAANDSISKDDNQSHLFFEVSHNVEDDDDKI